MIKKLRIKFVIVSMLSLLLVLTVIMGAVYFINYKNMVDEADGLLTILLDNDGTFQNRRKTPCPTKPDKKTKAARRDPDKKALRGKCPRNPPTLPGIFQCV